jgi:hypothetical protein
MAELQQQILGRQDRDLYEAAKKYLDVEHFDKYLQYAPLKTMAGQVVAYKKYLGEIDPNATVEFRLVLKIEWGKVSGSEIHVRAWWNGNSAIYYGKNDKVKAEANSTTNWMGSDSLRAKPSDKVTITIKVDNIGWVSDDHYEAPVTNKEVSELASGYVVSLQDTSAHTEAGKAYLVLYGYPKPPELPEWHGVR